MRMLKQTLREGLRAAVIVMSLCASSQAARAATQVIVEKTGPEEVTVRYRLSAPETELVFAASG